MSANLDAWREKVLYPLLRGQELSGEELKQLGGLALLSADADRVQEYVFESARLPEIRGASALLDHLNQQEVRGVLETAGLPSGFIDDNPPGCLVYVGGGSLLALVPQSAAEGLKAALERRYPEQTGAATLTCVALDALQGEGQEPFGQLVKRAGFRLRQEKGEKTALPFFEPIPFARRCDSCRKRPAVQFLTPYLGDPPEARCRVCAIKRSHSERGVWHEQLGAIPAEDLEKIGEPSSGYIGFIYADGNNMGDWFSKAGDVHKYRLCSKQVQQATKQAVLESLRLHFGPAYTDPFEVVLVGGDDAMLIVPANHTLPVARDLCDRFELEMKEVAGTEEPLTMSAGVVMADHHTPIYFLRRLAKDLLKSAKKDDRGSTVDFLVLKSQGTLHAEQARDSYVLDKEYMVLNHGAYTLCELDRLLALVKQGKGAGFPRSQLHNLQFVLRQGRHASALAYLYQLARSREETAHFLEAFADEWCPKPEDTPPWRQTRIVRVGREYRTPWADMVALWDFVA